MAKKIVRITESDLINIVKRVLNEQGGYDDTIQMAQHGGAVIGGLKKIIDNIIELLSDNIESLKTNIHKHKRMKIMVDIGNVLDIVEDNLRKIRKEIMGNRELRAAVSSLRMSVEKGRDRLKSLSSFTSGFAHPEMPGGLTGAGMEIPSQELNDKLFDILLSISTKAEKLAFELRDEEENIIDRLGRLDNLN